VKVVSERTPPEEATLAAASSAPRAAPAPSTLASAHVPALEPVAGGGRGRGAAHAVGAQHLDAGVEGVVDGAAARAHVGDVVGLGPVGDEAGGEGGVGADAAGGGDVGRGLVGAEGRARAVDPGVAHVPALEPVAGGGRGRGAAHAVGAQHLDAGVEGVVDGAAARAHVGDVVGLGPVGDEAGGEGGVGADAAGGGDVGRGLVGAEGRARAVDPGVAHVPALEPVAGGGRGRGAAHAVGAQHLDAGVEGVVDGAAARAHVGDVVGLVPVGDEAGGEGGVGADAAGGGDVGRGLVGAEGRARAVDPGVAHVPALEPVAGGGRGRGAAHSRRLPSTWMPASTGAWSTVPPPALT